MKTILILLNISLIGIQSLSAQTDEIGKINVKINNDNVDLTLYPNPVEDVLNLKTLSTIDFIRLYNNEGQLVMQFVPVNNRVYLDDVEPGIYMACSYHEGKRVNKSILKKL